ncbi:MAG TPA: [FeFe] hydrogenase H-cluster maturation GTPase HydF [Candidatus Scybalomonas excrementigallinarum]|nr:[FeFe] hydrogenase H-cluster maturation GTPase HydF [Candidatus Scybalomonas excrementigallinarum]
MGLNSTPSAERLHIGIFGKRNAGKSSLINAITGQSLAIVSDIKGTTTDPVSKAMELLPLGPVVMIDTPGLDDVGVLGQMRISKTYQVLNKTDIALLVIDGSIGMSKEDEALLEVVKEKKIPYLIVVNKIDEMREEMEESKERIYVSATSKLNIEELKERIGNLIPKEEKKRPLVADLLKPLDFVILVVPIDASAPKGRLILPQQQTIRDIIEAGAVSIVVKDTELKETLEKLGQKPRLVITDSQAFSEVAKQTPDDVPLTSFSILFARYKGDLWEAVKGARAIENLKDGDTILMAEGCTHHRQCEDIGTVKIPNWIRNYTKGKNIRIETCSGTEFPSDLSKYRLIVHCGGCTLNEREMKYRIRCAVDQGIPITNYGIFIAYMKGILERSIEPLNSFT